MKEVPKKDVPEVSGGVVPSPLPGRGIMIPGDPWPGAGPEYPQLPTIPCFPDPTHSIEK